MNTNTLAKNYSQLSAEERFPLIVAAGVRGDTGEQERLKSAGRCITFSVADHWPFAHAFDDLARFVLLELMELAGLQRAFLADVRGALLRDDNANESDWTTATECWGLCLAQGFILRLKAEGWRLFCEQLGVPPFAVWKCLPGFRLLEMALAHVTDTEDPLSFDADGMARFLNERKPEDAPEVMEAELLTPEKIAADLDETFRQFARRWGS